MKIDSIDYTIQGEGRYAGEPMLFIRLFGCNLSCGFCDTPQDKYLYYTPEKLAQNIDEYFPRTKTICWTGGEPLLQFNEIHDTIMILKEACQNHLETNASQPLPFYIHLFDYICFSPKTVADAERTQQSLKDYAIEVAPLCYDIKVVTDLKNVGLNLIGHATMLMPLTTKNKKDDDLIKKRVWDYCIEKNLRYSPRLQIDLEKK